ncbi:MAG TPA: DUF364 domain-containing protein [Geobacteraceae bacterium]|nr:DUF364 domain-containing protein [Geobacteraceae bacterium]
MTFHIQKRLVDYLAPNTHLKTVADVRIGLGYTAVRLESGHAGVAWTPKSEAPCCTHFQAAGTLTGRPVAELLAMLADEKSGLARAVGLAAANALLAALPRPVILKEEVISSLNVTPDDRVAMVGYFGPVISQLKKAGCRLDIVELNPAHGENTHSPEQGKDAMAGCTIAVITGTSLINGTFDEVVSGLGNPRAAVLLGPSSPLCGDVFSGTKITHVAGSRVKDADAVLRVVSEGGGTMLMKPFLDFESVLVP